MRPTFARAAVLRREVAALDLRRDLGWWFLVLVTAVVLAVTWTGSRTPASASSLDVGRRLFHLFFGLAHATALLASSLAAATSLARERWRFADEALLLAGVTARRRVAQHFAAASLVTAALLLGVAPVAAIPFAFGGVDGRVTATALLSLLATVALGSSLGVLVGTYTRSVVAARLLATLASLTLGASLWVTVGAWLGRRLCGHFHVGHHGLMWWAQAVHDARLPTRLRALLAMGLFALAALGAAFVLTVARARIEEPSADRATPMRAAWASLSLVALAVLAPVPWLASGVAARAWSASVVVIVWSALQAAGVFALAGGDVDASRRALARGARPFLARVRGWPGPGLLRGALVHLAVATGGALVLAWSGHRAADLVRRSSTIMPVAPVALALIFTVALALLTGAAALLRALTTPARARTVLLVSLVAWCVAPLMVGDVLGGAAGPFSFTPRVMALSPVYAVRVVETLARGAITFVDLRTIDLRSMRDLAPLVFTVPAEAALAAVLLAVTAAVLRRRKAP